MFVSSALQLVGRGLRHPLEAQWHRSNILILLEMFVSMAVELIPNMDKL
jgi:hypothetical protein